MDHAYKYVMLRDKGGFRQLSRVWQKYDEPIYNHGSRVSSQTVQVSGVLQHSLNHQLCSCAYSGFSGFWISATHHGGVYSNKVFICFPLMRINVFVRVLVWDLLCILLTYITRYCPSYQWWSWCSCMGMDDYYTWSACLCSHALH